MIKIQKVFLVAICCLPAALSWAQQGSKLPKDIADIHIQPADIKISFPTVPDGYHLILKGSDHNPIIDSSGRIEKPLTDTKVNLYFQLISNSSDSIHYDISKKVVVPGRFMENEGNDKPFVIPALQEWHGKKGIFKLSSATRIVLDINSDKKDKAYMQLGSLLQKEIKQQTGLNLKTFFGKPRTGDIYLSLHEKDNSIGEEGYYFDIDQYITISATAYRGLFWGTRTLLQLLEQNNSHSIPMGTARDYPQYKVRGFVLDDGRKFFSLQFLQDYVKLLSYYKMNDFQIHLNDNGFRGYFGNNWDSTYSAFRLENNTYPGLTAKDGSYSKKEFIDLQLLANQYGVDIIPEIDVPAHSLAFTKAVPEIASKKYGRDHLDLHNPLTNTVIQNVFKEYLTGPNQVFIGNTVDIGTDEYAKADAEAFRAFTDQMIKFVQGYGKKVRLWGALSWAEGSTPVTVKDVTMNTWYNGYANPVDMKKLGYPQISTPDGWLYIVPAAGYYYDYLNLKNLYNKWTPSIIGDIHFEPGDPSIVGGSFAEWNDIVGNGISEKDVNDRVFPSIQVLAQKMWNGADSSISYEDFAELSKRVGEGPALNIRGKLGDPKHPLVAEFPFNRKTDDAVGNIEEKNVSYAEGIKGDALQFTGKNSMAKLPYLEIGYDYTVSFWINPSVNNLRNVPIFHSPNSIVALNQEGSGNLGFSRDGYHFEFNYRVPVNTWTHIVITGTNKGTSLFVNGKLQDRLYDRLTEFSDMEKKKKPLVQTLFFPLQYVGGFSGKLDELKIWNKVLSDEEIGKLSF